MLPERLAGYLHDVSDTFGGVHSLSQPGFGMTQDLTAPQLLPMTIVATACRAKKVTYNQSRVRPAAVLGFILEIVH